MTTGPEAPDPSAVGRSDARRALRWGLAALFVALTLASLGAFVNDEVLQAIAFHNLLDGNLFVVEEPSHLWSITEDVRFDRRLHMRIGDVGVPNASGMLNFVALPVGWLLLGIDRLVPVRIPLLAAWGFLGFHATRWGTDAARELWGRRPVDWGREALRVPAWAWLGWAWTALAAWGAVSMPPLDLEHWVTFVALGLTDTLLYAATAGLVWWVVARAVPDGRRLAGLATLLFMLSPALFWAAGAKYHVMQALLPVLVAALYHEGVRGRRSRLVFAAAAVAGLAVWSNEMGVAVLGAVGLVHAGALLRGAPASPWSWRDRRHVLGFGGSALVGLVPWAAYGTATYTAPWSTPPGAGAAPPSEGVERSAGRVSAEWQFDEPVAALRNLWDAHLDAGHFEGDPAAVLVIAPWALVAVLALLRLRKPPGVRLLALHVLLTWLAVGPRLPTQGSGFDPRFLSGLWPGYAILAAWGLHGLDWDRAARRRVAAWAAAGTLAVLALLWLLHAAGVVFGEPDSQQVDRAQVWVGRAVLLLVALAAVLYAHRPSRRFLPPVLGLAVVPAALWLVDALLVHHRRMEGIDGAADAAFLTPVGAWLWDWAWDTLVPCVGRYVCGVR